MQIFWHDLSDLNSLWPSFLYCRIPVIVKLRLEVLEMSGIFIHLEMYCIFGKMSDCLMFFCVCPQVLEKEEQILHLRAQVVALQGDLQVHSAQLESGDDALTALSQQLRDTLGELECSRKHAQECEVLISALQDTSETLRHQVRNPLLQITDLQMILFTHRVTMSLPIFCETNESLTTSI